MGQIVQYHMHKGRQWGHGQEWRDLPIYYILVKSRLIQYLFPSLYLHSGCNMHERAETERGRDQHPLQTAEDHLQSSGRSQGTAGQETVSALCR